MYRMGSGKAKTQIINAYYDKCHYKLGGQREFEAMQNWENIFLRKIPKYVGQNKFPKDKR